MTVNMLTLLFLVINNIIGLELAEININANKIEGYISPFWENTGFCPPDPHEEAYKFFLSKDMEQNLILLGSIPTHNLLQVRIHYLLNLIRLGRKNFLFNMTHMDQFLDLIYQNGLKLGFEIMGNPSNIFSNFDNDSQVYAWRDLVFSIAQRYLEKYGLDYVSQWNFESWNEPLVGHFDRINMTASGFLNYYDASSDGLRRASKNLKFGGPGGECHNPRSKKSFCWLLLHHCNNGTSFFGKKNIQLDYISIHKKGSGTSQKIIDLELDTVNTIQRLYPNLKDVAIHNNEADPMVGWSKNLEWRGDASYAAITTKIIDLHIKEYFLFKSPRKDIPFHLLSNDNAFLSYQPHNFNQRTLLARFQINNTNPKQVQFIKKPIYSVMALWHKLGNKIIAAKVSGEANIGVIATKLKNNTSTQIAALIYNSNDSTNQTSSNHIELTIKLPNWSNNTKSYKMVCYTVNNAGTNPYNVWKQHGRPAYPNRSVFAEMRNQEEPLRFQPWISFQNSNIQLKFLSLLPSVTLVHLSQKPAEIPEKINGVKFFRISKETVLISWQSLRDNPIILTYEVQYSQEISGPFWRINTNDTIFASFQYSREGYVKGYYRVRAKDYWNQNGPFSTTSHYENQ